MSEQKHSAAQQENPIADDQNLPVSVEQDAQAQEDTGTDGVPNPVESTAEKSEHQLPETAKPEHQLEEPESEEPEHQLPEPETAKPEHQLPQSEAEEALPEGEESAQAADDAATEAGTQEVVQQEQASGAEEEEREGKEGVDEVFHELMQAKAQGTPIEVTGLRRVRGGILVEYKGKSLFLPVSQLSDKPNPPENEILSYVKKTFPVHVYRIFPDDPNRVIVTRKEVIRQERLQQLQEGELVEGRVVGMTSYGVFIDLGGVEGMAHISELGRSGIQHPREVVKMQEKVVARVLSVDRESGRISLSLREYIRKRDRQKREQLWEQIKEQFSVGMRIKGTVRRLLDVGAIVTIDGGVEGIIPLKELSWARRILHPAEMLKPGDEIEAEVIDLDERRKRLVLSYRALQPNPWESIEERFPIGTKIAGKVTHLLEKGVTVNIAEDVDAFLPKSKMVPELRRKQKPFEIGDTVEVFVMDVEPEKHSLIVGMEGFDRPVRSQRPVRGKSKEIGKEKTGRVRLADLLSEEERRKLFGEEEQSDSETSGDVEEPKSAQDTEGAAQEPDAGTNEAEKTDGRSGTME